MDLTRRDFLRTAGAASVAAVLFAGCAIPEREIIKQSPRDIPEDIVSGLEDWYATTCVFCTDAHGIIVRVVEGRAKKIEGNPDHPVNRGKVMARCLMGVQRLYHPDRLAGPVRVEGDRGSGQFQPVDWESGLSSLTAAIREAGPQNTVLITGPLTGHLGYVARAFAAGTGIQHLPLEPIEQAVVRLAVKNVFGQERLPHFDIANAGTVLSFGADFLESWLTPVAYSNAYGEFRQGEGRTRGTLIHADSRFSMTAASADTWLPVAAGQEGVLAMSIAHVLVEDGFVDTAVLNRVTGGVGAAAFEAYEPEVVADRVASTRGAITAEKIREIAHALADHRPALVIAGGTAAAQTNGLFNVSAALTLNLLLSNVGVKGGVVFNPDPPIEKLRDLTPPATLAQWKALKVRLEAREIQLVLVHDANPAHALRSIGFAEALNGSATIISFSNLVDETTHLADLVLPDSSSLEAWGTGVPDPAPGYPVVTLQQPVVPALIDREMNVVYDSRPFGDVLLSTARALGIPRLGAWESMEALVRADFNELFKQNAGRGSVQAASLEAFWVGVLQRGGWWDTSRKAATTGTPPGTLPSRVDAIFFGPTGDDTFLLMPFTTIGIGDGSTAHTPWGQSTPDPVTSMTWITWVEVNNRVAHERGFKDGDVVRVESPTGAVELPVYIHPGMPPGVVSVPVGRGHTQSGQYAAGRGANVLSILTDAEAEGAGSLAWGATRVRLVGTGRRIRMPRMEGGFTNVQLDDAPLIQLTPG